MEELKKLGVHLPSEMKDQDSVREGGPGEEPGWQSLTSREALPILFPTLQVTALVLPVCKQTGDFSLFGVWAKNIPS